MDTIIARLDAKAAAFSAETDAAFIKLKAEGLTMASPNWRTAVAKDGDTACSTLQHEDGSISIRLSAGAVSIVASISPAKLAFLFETTAFLFETTGCATPEREAA